MAGIIEGRWRRDDLAGVKTAIALWGDRHLPATVIAQQARQELKQRSLVAIDQLIQRLLLAAPKAGEQLRVRDVGHVRLRSISTDARHRHFIGANW